MTELAASNKADMNVKLVEIMVCVQNVVYKSHCELTSKSLKNAADAAPAVKSNAKQICFIRVVRNQGFFPNRSKTKERKGTLPETETPFLVVSLSLEKCPNGRANVTDSSIYLI